jgi:uncharacterized protein YqeY
MSDAAQALKLRLRADLKAAMQARNAVETSLLRNLMAAIDNAQAQPVDLTGPASQMRAFGDGTGEVARLALSAERLARLLETEASARDDASAEMRALGRTEEADRLATEAAIVRRYG